MTVREDGPKYWPGDILWARETWRVTAVSDRAVFFEYKTGDSLIYETTDQAFLYKMAGKARWQPSIFMPRVAARLFSEVKSVRIERLQEITEEDAMAEGVERIDLFDLKQLPNSLIVPGGAYGKGFIPKKSYKAGFYKIWEELNAKRAYPWESNPWVWVYEFMRMK
jgi:hypothetical protein